MTNPETAGVEPVASDLFWHVRSHEEIRTASLPVLNDGMIYGWRTTGGAVYAGEGYPVPIRRFALDNTACAELMIKRAHPPAAREDGEAVRKAEEWLRACSEWLLTNDLDMQMPDGVLDTDPLDIADALATTRPAPEQAPDQVDCERCCGNGELVSDWGTYLHPPEGAPDEAGTMDCPDCDGRGTIDAPDHANCAVGEGKAITTEQLGEIMQEEWGEICEDTQAHPLDMRREGRKLFYDPHHWTAAIADRLNQWIPMPTPAAIRAETTARIVAWLLDGAPRSGIPMNQQGFDDVAESIERGDHLTGGGV